jgi:CheY-like chemotaxis protein
MTTHPSILLIEDSPGECELFRLALVQTGLDVALYMERDPEAAFHFLTDRAGLHQSSIQARPSSLQERDHPGLPSLILLDLQLRGQNGCDFLKRLRADPRFASIPVVVFTTSDASSDIAAGYANGTNGYVVKPGTLDELVRFVRDLCGYWLKWNRTLSMVETKC